MAKENNFVELVCTVCGRTVTIKSRGWRKYCDECAKLTETQKKKKTQERLEEEAAAAARLLECQRQSDPFNYKYMSERRLGAVIKMFRMTYGTYTAAYRSGFIVQLLKSKGFADPEKMIRNLEVE